MKTTDRIKRDLIVNDWVDFSREPLYSTELPIKYGLTPVDQLQAYALESLYTALTHTDPMIAFRALLQAYAYNAELKGLKVAYNFLNDGLLEARNRIEDMLKVGAPLVKEYLKTERKY